MAEREVIFVRIVRSGFGTVVSGGVPADHSAHADSCVLFAPVVLCYWRTCCMPLCQIAGKADSASHLSLSMPLRRGLVAGLLVFVKHSCV